MSLAQLQLQIVTPKNHPFFLCTLDFGLSIAEFVRLVHYPPPYFYPHLNFSSAPDTPCTLQLPDILYHSSAHTYFPSFPLQICDLILMLGPVFGFDTTPFYLFDPYSTPLYIACIVTYWKTYGMIQIPPFHVTSFIYILIFNSLLSLSSHHTCHTIFLVALSGLCSSLAYVYLL